MHTNSRFDLSSWLRCPDSLTQRLKTRAGGYELHILTQTWIDDDNWLSNRTHPQEFPVLRREILICAQSIPCWYGRSYFTRSLCQNEAWLLERIQTEPLGHILFNEPCIERVAFEITTINPQDAAWCWTDLPLIQQDNKAAMRLSQYRVGKEQGLWVSELFLQGLEEVLQCP